MTVMAVWCEKSPDPALNLALSVGKIARCRQKTRSVLKNVSQARLSTRLDMVHWSKTVSYSASTRPATPNRITPLLSMVPSSPPPASPNTPCLVDIVGLGQDRPADHDRCHQVIQAADVLVAGERILTEFPDFSGERIVIKAPLSSVLEKLDQARDAGRRVVVLVGGDPCFYGIGPLLARRWGRENVRLHPATTTLQAAAALLGIAWQGVATVSLHGRNRTTPLFAVLGRHPWVAVYTDHLHTPAILAAMLLERGADNLRMWVFENLGLADQRWGMFPLEEAQTHVFSPLNLVLLERFQEPEIRLTLGMSEQAYVHEQGMITKPMVRAAALAALSLEPENLLWDLGAGCGSVGIEAGLFLPAGGVVAVEKEARRVVMIRKNVRRTNAFWVHVLQGRMPNCLPGLPEPDRIFLGGGLSQGDGLLETVCTRLRPGGRLVAALVLLESLEQVRGHLDRLHWPVELIQVQVSHATPLAGGVRLNAQNPVFLISSRKPDS
ncbi:MAG: precorrin-6y C5,15-methyltransferase (decarboxylating) subunit CbiE [Desulfovibrionales bacterium]|nr:MAG: precorrin-6y C5,15-methyltransferase (decarboxylating) subunit CbiE [Desulfovibrionales bacterium]